MFTRLTKTVFSSALVLLLLASGPILAQEFVFDGAGMPDEIKKEMRKQLVANIAQSKIEFEQKFSVRIEEMTRACELSDDQVKKLTIAAKGAVSQSLKKMRESGQQFLGQLNVDDEDEDADEEGADEEEADDEAGFAMGVNRFVLAGGPGMFGGMGGNRDPEREKIWRKTVKTVLTDTQKQRHDEIVAAREKYQRDAAVMNFVASVDESLLLSAEQRAKMTSFIDKKYGDVLVKENANDDVFDWAPAGGQIQVLNGAAAGILQERFIVPAANDEAAPAKSDSPVAAFLGKSQMEIWTTTFEPQLAMMTQGGMMRFIGN